MTKHYVPYEVLARAEAEDITVSLPSALGELTAEQTVALQELLAGAYGRGLDAGFAISDFAGPDPGTLMDAYNAGIVEGRKT